MARREIRKVVHWKELDLCMGVSDESSSIIKDFDISDEVISRSLLGLGDCLDGSFVELE